ncbi:aminomethyl-transferring glycine dehydrogenase subunit GcvPA [Candidatus Bathyarchaeota archaeon]|nr:MAG: aminomethyl-transferring glycine dehydrogenase subunit GcvPA [Candidatus Bathyarchaeota archaeon]
MATFDHPFLPNAGPPIRKMMLDAIGVASIEELYSDIPAQVRTNHPLKVDWLPSEQEVKSHLERVLAENKSASDMPIFLGGGIYNHYLPAAVKAILGRTEFQTSYTPYQAEISQGLLQSLFEFQSMIADLTQMDAVNSSLYDGSTALGEAARMASRATGRKKILVPRSLHPAKLSVLKNYTEPAGIGLETFMYDKETGGVSSADLQSKVDRDTAAVYCEVPSFFGILDQEVANVPSICHSRGALSIVGFDPISLGGLKPPGEYGADIVIAEGQSISTEMNFGGPALGIIGCRGENLIRQLPGRLIGMTTTLDGKEKAFSMVLQTREQHIRREKATSNICTNEALFAIGAAAYLSLLGPKGLRQLFESILVKTSYAIKMLSELPGVVVPRFTSPHYQEFVASFKGTKGTLARLNKSLLSNGVHGGKSLVKDFPELGESALFCVTETHSAEAIDKLRLLIEKLQEA